MSTINNQQINVASDAKAIEGIGLHFAKLKTISLAGTSYTPKSLTAILQAEIDGTTAIDQARAGLKEQVAQAVPVRAQARAVRSKLKAYILANYGASAAQVLADFGFSGPKTRAPVDVRAKVAAVDRAQATRKARNTMGKRQRKLVKGAVTAPAAPVAVSPVAPTPQAPVATPPPVVSSGIRPTS